MSSPQNGGPRLSGLSVVPDDENRELAARDAPPTFDGTIASACESIGISVEEFIGMARWAKESDARVAQLLDTWDALDPSEQRATGTADAVRKQAGLAPVDLLRVVADVTCRVEAYRAQIIAAVSHPDVVAKTVERALTDKGIADRILLAKATGFLPVSKGSQTTIAVMQNPQANAATQSVAAPRPEEIIRRVSKRFNEARGLPRAPVVSIPVPGDSPDVEEGDDR